MGTLLYQVLIHREVNTIYSKLSSSILFTLPILEKD